MNRFFYHIYWLFSSLLSGWLIMRSMKHFIKIKRKPWIKCLMLFGCATLSTTVIFIGDSFNILATTPCFLLVTLIACEGTKWQKVTIGTMYANTILAFNALRDNYLKPLFSIWNPREYYGYTSPYEEIYAAWYHSYPLSLLSSSTATLLFALTLYAGIKKFAPNKDYSLSDSLWKLLLLLTATPFGIILSIVTLYSGTNKYSVWLFHPPADCLALLVITLMSFISLLWCVTVLAKQQRLEQQNMFMEINRKYYEAMEQQHTEIRRLKHDLANHMQVLSALPEQERDSYIKNLAEHTAAMHSLSYCGDSTVNAVLSVKKPLIEQHGIHMELSLDIPQELPFDKTDICALYANALDNAVEACMKLEQEKRFITVKSKARKGLFCLEVSNPAPENSGVPINQAIYDGLEYDTYVNIIPTSKKDKTNHGFGLKSIRETVVRYHGNMELKTVNGVFDLFLYMPL